MFSIADIIFRTFNIQFFIGFKFLFQLIHLHAKLLLLTQVWKMYLLQKHGIVELIILNITFGNSHTNEILWEKINS